MTDLNSIFLRQDIAAALAADREDDLAEEAQRVALARIEAATAEHAALQAAEQAAQTIRDAEPPEIAAALTNGLSPMRARLVRFVAWVESLQAEHDLLVAGREQYLTSMGIAPATAASLAALIKADKTGLIEAMSQGGKGLSQHQLRSHERARLEAKLVNDQHQAEISKAALVEVEAKIDALEKQIETVRSRHKSFVADALAEAVAASAGANLITKMDALHAGALTVMGAHGALQRLRGLRNENRRREVALPTPRLSTDRWHSATQDTPGHYTDSGSGYTIAFEVYQQDAEQKRWMEKAQSVGRSACRHRRIPMTTIDRLTGIATTDSFYLGVVRAASDGSGVTVTPLNPGQPAFSASTAENIPVNPGLKRLLDRAGLSPPPPGQVLSISHVNDKLAAAQMSMDDRLEIKNALVRMRLVEIGKAHSFG